MDKRTGIGLVVLALLLLPFTAGAMGHFALPARSINLGDLTLTGVYPRIFSPNGDGANDKVGFHFVNPEDAPISGSIFGLSGAKVADIQPGFDTATETVLFWNGKDSDGRAVPGGIYLYQIDYQNHHATGSVVVAR